MYAVLLIPIFRLQSVLRLQEKPVSPREPVVLTEAAGRRSVVVEMNRAAAQLTIETGMTAAQARARSEEIRVFSHSASAESLAARVLLDVALTASPVVEQTAAGVCTIDLRGRRDVEWTALGRQMTRRLKETALEACVGFGETADLAHIAARLASARQRVRLMENRAAFIQQAPLAAAAPSASLQKIFEQWGLRTLGDLARLQRDPLGRRLGQEALRLWDIVQGRHERILNVCTPPPKFHEEVELEFEVETLEPLLFLIRRLLEQLALQLKTACQCAEYLHLKLLLSEGEPYQRSFRLPEPTASADLLFRVLHQHLESVQTEASIRGLEMGVKAVDPPNRQVGLFNAALKDPWRFSETQAQLVGLVGSENVGSPRLQETHRPDALRLEPLPREIRALPPDAEPGAQGLPLRRFRPPLPIQVHTAAGRPAYVVSGTPVARGSVGEARGPYRLSGEWWEKHRYWNRSEWDVELTSDQALCRLVECNGQWFLEGVYD